MFRSFQIVFLVATLSCARSAPADDAQLSKADIPLNVSPEVRRLIEQTFSENLQEREFAAKKLGEMHEQAVVAIPFLMRLSGDAVWAGTATPRYYADQALVSIGEPALEACIASAKAIAAKPPPPGAHLDKNAIVSLGEFKYHFPRAVDTLLDLLKSPDAEVRRQAVLCLDGCTDTRATLPLLEIIAHGIPEMRLFAMYCFAHLRDPRCVEPLLTILETRGRWQEAWPPHLARATAAALGCQRDRRAVRILLKMLNEPSTDAWVRDAAAISLGQIGDPSSLEPLVDVLLDRGLYPEVRASAALGIGEFHGSAGEVVHGRRVLDLLADLLNAKNELKAVRVAVAQALGKLGDREAVDALCVAAESHSEDPIGFWAAVNAVKLTDGDINDIAVLRAIQNYHCIPDNRCYQEEQDVSLAKLSANGGWRVRLALGRPTLLTIAVPIGVILAISGAIWWFLRRRLNAVESAEAEASTSLSHNRDSQTDR